MSFVKRLGYIPLHFDDAEYIKEYNRQQRVAPCLCSNCRGDLVHGLMEGQLRATRSTFNDISTDTRARPIPHVKTVVRRQIRPCTILTCPSRDKIRACAPFKELKELLLKNFDALYSRNFPRHDNFILERTMLSDDQAWVIAKNCDVLGQSASLREILGSEACDGQFDCISKTIVEWKKTESYLLIGRQLATLSKTRLDKARAKEEKRARKEEDQLRLESDRCVCVIDPPVDQSHREAKDDDSGFQTHKRMSSNQLSPVTSVPRR
ncbi:hypothetical protein DFH28DRAFT_881149 [Melampsora americana]|nr:hypothetical protein DFH28DRAFT_881149 [Melampsora americana]